MQWTLPRRELYPNGSESRRDSLTAAADIVDDGEHYELILEMPGVTQENLSIDLERDSLVVRGTRPGHAENQKLLYNGRDVTRQLEKRFRVGEDVDRSQVMARLENGLLRITLPRKAEEKSRRIEIEVK